MSRITNETRHEETGTGSIFQPVAQIMENTAEREDVEVQCVAVAAWPARGNGFTPRRDRMTQ